MADLISSNISTRHPCTVTISFRRILSTTLSLLAPEIATSHRKSMRPFLTVSYPLFQPCLSSSPLPSPQIHTQSLLLCTASSRWLRAIFSLGNFLICCLQYYPTSFKMKPVDKAHCPACTLLSSLPTPPCPAPGLRFCPGGRNTGKTFCC